MNNSRVIAATIVGAVIGGVAGYLFFTERGRSVRRQIEPALEDFSRELMSFRSMAQKTAGLANEGWKLLNDTLGQGWKLLNDTLGEGGKLLNDTLGEGGKPPARSPSRQSSPF